MEYIIKRTNPKNGQSEFALYNGDNGDFIPLIHTDSKQESKGDGYIAQVQTFRKQKEKGCFFKTDRELIDENWKRVCLTNI